MRRTTVFFDEQVERELKAAARREGRPAASIVREAVEQYVLAHRPRGRRTMGFIGVGASGQADTAERHEELLWKEDAVAVDGGTPPKSSRARPRRQASPDRRTRHTPRARKA